jgi:hypothetical protein
MTPSSSGLIPTRTNASTALLNGMGRMEVFHPQGVAEAHSRFIKTDDAAASRASYCGE